MSQICSNCHNGCAEIVSDKCIMYTGVAVSVLGIEKGDSLSYVEQALITFLTATLNGSGVTIEIEEDLYCEVVSQYLQECSTVTALDLFKALVQAACNIQEQIDTINTTITTLNTDYDIECLEEVTNSSDTHDVLQAVITKLCSIDTELTALALDVDTNYVKIADLNGYIAAYITSSATGTNFSSRMVPFSILPYYGSLGFFDATGAGTGEWIDIYLCNGLNGTPDLRGRAVVGAIVGVPGGALDTVVNPSSSPFNPNYSLGTPSGANSIILATTQIPAHNHTATTVISPNPHTHTITGSSGGDTGVGSIVTNPPSTPEDGGLTDSEDLTAATTIASTGGGEAHSNIQPARAVYFIIYIPS